MRKLLALCCLLFIVASCQKNSSSQSSSKNATSTKPVTVAVLKSYLAKLTNVNIDQIGYNTSSQQFTAFGKNQISFTALSQLYKRMPIRSNLKVHGPESFMAAPPPGGGGGTTPTPIPTPTPTPAPAPTLPPYTDPGDSLLSYSNNLLNYNASSMTIQDDATTDYTDVTQGAVISYTIAVTGSSGGSVSGSTLDVKYNQSQTVKVTVQISVPHDPTTGAVSNFTVNATLELFTGNILTPSGIPGYGISLTQKNVKATDVIVTETFNFTFPVATASLNGTHFCMYWNNATSGPDEKIIQDPVYTIAVQGLPSTTGNPVTEQPGPEIYLYRMFYSPGGEHFYTSSNTERQQLLDQKTQYFPPTFWSWFFGNNDPAPNIWTGEANIGHIWNYQAQGTVPLFRLFNGKVHMFTIDPNERDNIISTLGYHSEGITGYVYSTQVAGSQPVYRYNGVKATGHFFTTNYNEIGNGTAAGFAYEGVGFYDLP